MDYTSLVPRFREHSGDGFGHALQPVGYEHQGVPTPSFLEVSKYLLPGAGTLIRCHTEAQNPLFPIICVSQSYHHALALNVGVPLGISPLEVDSGPVQEDERAVGKGLIHELLIFPVSRLNDLLNGRFRDWTARLSRQDLADLRIGHAPVIQS